MGYGNQYYRWPGDERGVGRDTELNIPALASADKTLGNHQVLVECMQGCLRRVDGETATKITRKFFEHRLGNHITSLLDIGTFEQIPSGALETLFKILVDAVEREFQSSESTASFCT